MTAKQRALLVFVHRRITETGICPSYREMAIGIGLKPERAPNVHALLKLLERGGWVRMHRNQVRATEVLRVPDGAVLSAAEIAWCHDHADHVRRLIGAGP